MNDASKRGRSRPKSRDETPEYPIEGTELITDISHKKNQKNTTRDHAITLPTKSAPHEASNKANIAIAS